MVFLSAPRAMGSLWFTSTAQAGHSIVATERNEQKYLHSTHRIYGSSDKNYISENKRYEKEKLKAYNKSFTRLKSAFCFVFFFSHRLISVRNLRSKTPLNCAQTLNMYRITDYQWVDFRWIIHLLDVLFWLRRPFFNSSNLYGQFEGKWKLDVLS